jgi:uncharacterized protein
MSERTELLPGSFCWPELATPDPAKAKAFYSRLFGWTAVDVPSSEGHYALLQLRGLDVAGLRSLMADEKAQGVPSHFMSYVSTASADAAAAKAAELGGKVCAGPFDVEGIGRMAVVLDPGGAAFALWEARGHIGARVVGENGALCWTELVTRDADGAKAFYSGLFGWTFRASESLPMEYVEIHREEQGIGGILPMTGTSWGDVPPHWMPYFLVPDCAAAVVKAGELGGGVAVPATEIPHVGSFAVLHDDQGARFSVLAPAPGLVGAND